MTEGIESAELVCEAFTKWGLKKYTCDIKYYTEEPLDDLFFVICSVLNLAEDKRQSKCGLGILLGFALKDQKDEEGRKIYYDKAEEGLFEDILRLVENERLIRVEGGIVSLTELGRISLKERKHYKFFSGTQEIYEHSAINSKTPMSLLMFPFYADMGISTSVKTDTAIWPEDHGIENIIYYENDQLKKRLELQSKEKSNIYFAEEQKYFEIEAPKVPVRLYKRGDEYIPVLLNGDRIAQKATELINNGLNPSKKENIILECLFQKLWNDDSAVLDYKSLEPYFDLVDYQELAKDSRVVWKDGRLFDKIVERASASCWRHITANCNVDVICKNLEKLRGLVDWPTLTERVDDSFLKNNFLTYPWDLEVISNDDERDIHVIEDLLLTGKESCEDWDWEALGERLTEDFVISHLDVVDVDLTKYTEDSEVIQNAIVSYGNRRWDWDKIEETFNLRFLLEHIEKLRHHLKFEPLFDRIFTSPIWAAEFIKSKTFRNAVENATRQGGALHSTTLNSKTYIWTNGIIDFLSSVGLILWRTTPYITGFECNPLLTWSKEFFNRYSKNVTTDEGRRFVSQQIKDADIIINANGFAWDWEAISSNTALLSDKRLFLLFGDNLTWSIVLKNQKNAPFLESIDKIDSMIGNDTDAWSSFSQIADLEYVKKTWHNLWDWQILTKRLFIGEGGISLNLNALGHKDFVSLWNWTYLSENVEIDFLKENLGKYGQYWDWNKVIPRIVPEERKFDTDLLRRYALTLAKVEDSAKRKNVWAVLTAQYTSIDDIKRIIEETGHDCSTFKWDIEQICKTKGFNIFRDLDFLKGYTDWDAISCSNAIDKCLTYNKRLGIKEKAWKEDVRKIVRDNKSRWNFYSLTRFESLKDERWFLSDYKGKIDWKHISQYSKVFCEKDKQTLNDIIEEYKSYIDFIALSKRDDVDINQIIKICPIADYDYNSLIERGKIRATMGLVTNNPKYAWDWHLITSSPDFQPTPDFLLRHIYNDINWEALSSSQDTAIWESEKLIKAVAKDARINQQINWFAITTADNFPISFSTFCVIPFEKLNWDKLSSRKEIIALLDFCKEWINWRVLSNSDNYGLGDINFLSRYADYLDWGEVCNKTRFKFSNEILEIFADYIDWTAASGSEDIEFSGQLVNKYIDRWNWAVLKTNKAFHNTVDITSLPYVKQKNIVRFVSHFNGINSEFCFDGRPKAYHFTHMDNAVKIIRSMKLQSRDLANGSFSNSAGSVVNKTDKAHKYARFYFAPKSPTQFYNEFLGKDKDDSSYYYEKAKNQKFPKCPLPVFFIFDIGEILSVFPDLCYYSNGNMQKNVAKAYRVTEKPDYIKANEIFARPDWIYKDERQQEFLVEGELDFSKLRNVQICCYNEYQANMLRKELRKEQNGSQWADIIYCNPDLYVQKNKQLTFEEERNCLKIYTDYKEPYELKISYTEGFEPTIINKDKIKGQKGNNIYMDSSVYLKKDAPFEVYFEVREPRYGSWLIYKNE